MSKKLTATSISGLNFIQITVPVSVQIFRSSCKNFVSILNTTYTRYLPDDSTNIIFISTLRAASISLSGTNSTSKLSLRGATILDCQYFYSWRCTSWSFAKCKHFLPLWNDANFSFRASREFTEKVSNLHNRKLSNFSAGSTARIFWIRIKTNFCICSLIIWDNADARPINYGMTSVQIYSVPLLS